MSNSFATVFGQLVDQLTRLPRQTPAHLQHLVIRVQRAKRQVEHGERTDGLDSLVRLRGRLEELALGLEELENLGGVDETKWSSLKRQAEHARSLLALELERAKSSVAALRHSRSSSSGSLDLPRRLPTPAPRPPASPPSLDAFLSRLEPQPGSSRSTTLARAQERAKSLSEAYSLFLLSTSPASVLPSGQTLSSVFRRASAANTSSASPSSAVSYSPSDAFSDQRIAALSVGLSSAASARGTWNTIARLLAQVCLPLVPGRSSQTAIKRKVEVLLLGSTSENETERTEPGEWDIAEGIDAVDGVLQVLKKLCAPARDGQVSRILDEIVVLRQNRRSGITAARGLVEVARDIVEFAKGMRDDLDRFRQEVKVEFAGEKQVLEAVREEAGERERNTVRELVRTEMGPKGVEEGRGIDDEIRRKTREWMRQKRRAGAEDREPEQITKVNTARALVNALFETQAIVLPPTPTQDLSPDSCSITSLNVAPPIFYSTSPRLFRLQNRFQALTILACLHMILLTTPGSPLSSPSTTPGNLMSRLWTILESEIPSDSSPTSATTNPTRLAHLSDEIISHLSRSDSESTTTTLSDAASTSVPSLALDEAVKDKVRTSVDRILRYQDPVFTLLQNRLREGIEHGLVNYLELRQQGDVSTRAKTSTTRGNGVPDELHSGRGTTASRPRNAARSSFTLAPAFAQRHGSEATELEIPTIKGYEGLKRQIDQTVQVEFRPVWEWLEHVWGDVLGWSPA